MVKYLEFSPETSISILAFLVSVAVAYYIGRAFRLQRRALDISDCLEMTKQVAVATRRIVEKGEELHTPPSETRDIGYEVVAFLDVIEIYCCLFNNGDLGKRTMREAKKLLENNIKVLLGLEDVRNTIQSYRQDNPGIYSETGAFAEKCEDLRELWQSTIE